MERTFIKLQLTKEEIEHLIEGLNYNINIDDHPQVIDTQLLKYFQSLLPSWDNAAVGKP